MPLALVFPGQGSHRPAALDAWSDHPAIAVLDEVEAGIGRDIRSLAHDPSTGGRTADAQPAILAASLVAWRGLSDAGVRAEVVAGHSLGEYTAAIAAGALGVEAGARVVAARGQAMAAACEATPGTMAAVVKLNPQAVEVLVDRIDDLVIANDNAPGQVVVAGSPGAIEQVRRQARDAGGRALPLDVEGAFHSPAMAPAVTAVRDALAAAEVRDPAVPVIAGATAREVTTAAQLTAGLVDGVLAPVRWREVQLRLVELGVTEVIEVGPGGVLAGLAKRTVPELQVHTLASPEDLETVLDALSVTARAS